jgi:hypothetical protein
MDETAFIQNSNEFNPFHVKIPFHCSTFYPERKECKPLFTFEIRRIMSLEEKVFQEKNTQALLSIPTFIRLNDTIYSTIQHIINFNV